MLTSNFYDFLKERESIRLRRLSGLPREQWTEDSIFKKFKFTNVKRQNDWTTRQFVDNFYDRMAHDDVKLANCVIARFFGLAESVQELGFQYSFMGDILDTNIQKMVSDRQKRRESVFTGAYIVPNCGLALPKHEIVTRVVQSVYDWVTATSPNWIDGSFKTICADLCKNINGMGSFMAKEVLLDMKLITDWVPCDWETYTPMGPGARRGAARVMTESGVLLRPLTEAAALDVALELYRSRHYYWPLEYTPLELCDIQFQLCEFDKYLRCSVDGGRAKTIFRPR